MNIPPMNQYDATANPILDFDTAPSNAGVYMATQPAASILSGLAPKPTTTGSLRSLLPLETLCTTMDFVHPDSAPENLLNQVIWKSVKGIHSKMPAIRHAAARLGTTPAARTSRKDGDD